MPVPTPLVPLLLTTPPILFAELLRRNPDVAGVYLKLSRFRLAIAVFS